jgi:inorganic pyrophosphatase
MTKTILGVVVFSTAIVFPGVVTCALLGLLAMQGADEALTLVNIKESRKNLWNTC